MKWIVLITALVLFPTWSIPLRAEVLPGLTRAGTGEVRYLGIFKVYDAMLFLPGEISRNEVLSGLHSKCLKVEYRIRLSGIPMASRSSRVHSTWLVVAGGPTMVSTAPRLAAAWA